VSTVIAPPSSGLSHVGRRDTNLATKLHGHGTSFPLKAPISIAASEENIYVSDALAGEVERFSRNGKLEQVFKLPASDIPDKLLLHGSILYGMNYQSKTFLRFVLISLDSLAKLRQRLMSIKVPAVADEMVIFPFTTSTMRLSSVGQLSDFAVLRDTVFTLDKSNDDLVAASFRGGGISRLGYESLFQNPSSLGSSGDRLVVSDAATGHFEVLQSVTPATFYFEGQTATHNVVALIGYLKERKLLPVHAVPVTTRATWQKVANALNLFPEQNSDEAAGMICRLNRSQDHDCHGKQLRMPLPLKEVYVPSLRAQPYIGTTEVILNGKTEARHSVSLKALLRLGQQVTSVARLVDVQATNLSDAAARFAFLDSSAMVEKVRELNPSTVTA
jgi:hypothetical protein